MTPDMMGVERGVVLSSEYSKHTCDLFPSIHTKPIKTFKSTQFYSYLFLLTFSSMLKSHYHIVSGDNAALLLGVLMQRSFQQNSGMLRQTELVIFSQTASLLLMNAAGRVSVSPAEITLNTGNMCPLWVGEHNKPDRQTYIGRQRGKLASVIWIFRGQMLNTATGEFET